MDTETEVRIRPRRRKRVIVEPYSAVSFYMPDELMERVRVMAEQARRSYSDVIEEALRFYLAAKIHIPDMHTASSRDGDREETR